MQHKQVQAFETKVSIQILLILRSYPETKHHPQLRGNFGTHSNHRGSFYSNVLNSHVYYEVSSPAPYGELLGILATFTHDRRRGLLIFCENDKLSGKPHTLCPRKLCSPCSGLKLMRTSKLQPLNVTAHEL